MNHIAKITLLAACAMGLLVTVQPTFAGAAKVAPRQDSLRAYRFQAPTPQLKLLHKRLIAKRTMSARQIQALADAGDRLAAFTFAKGLEQSDKPGLAPTAIHYYAMAAYLGQNAAIEPLTGLLRINHESLSAKQLSLAKQALQAAVRQGDSDAMLALAMFYRDGAPFGSNPTEEQSLLRGAAHGGNNTAAFMLGASLSTGTRSPAELKEAKELLKIASTGGVLMAQALLADLEAHQ